MTPVMTYRKATVELEGKTYHGWRVEIGANDGETTELLFARWFGNLKEAYTWGVNTRAMFRSQWEVHRNYTDHHEAAVA